MVAYRNAIQKRLRKARSSDWEREPPSVAAAGKFLGLDPSNPRQRERLLYILAEVTFGPPGKKGRPRYSRVSWDFQRLSDLGEIYQKQKRENPKLSNAKIARLINKHEKFKNDDPEQIRQRLRIAHHVFEWHLQDHDEDPEPDYGDQSDDWDEPDDWNED